MIGRQRPRFHPTQATTIPRGALLLWLLAGCAHPNGTGPQAAQAAGTSGRATVCVVAGYRFPTKNTVAHPAMTVSNDGFCNAAFRAADSAAMTTQLQSQPGHGRILAVDAGSDAIVRYIPVAGYEGLDSFAVATGSGGASVAMFTVTVVRP